MLILVSFLIAFLSFSFHFLSVPFLFALTITRIFFFGRKYHGNVSGIIWLQVVRDGMPQLVINSTVPLRTGTAVHALFCMEYLLFWFSCIETLFLKPVS